MKGNATRFVLPKATEIDTTLELRGSNWDICARGAYVLFFGKQHQGPIALVTPAPPSDIRFIHKPVLYWLASVIYYCTSVSDNNILLKTCIFKRTGDIDKLNSACEIHEMEFCGEIIDLICYLADTSKSELEEVGFIDGQGKVINDWKNVTR